MLPLWEARKTLWTIAVNLVTCTAPELTPDPMQTMPAKSFITNELRQGEEDKGSDKM